MDVKERERESISESMSSETNKQKKTYTENCTFAADLVATMFCSLLFFFCSAGKSKKKRTYFLLKLEGNYFVFLFCYSGGSLFIHRHHRRHRHPCDESASAWAPLPSPLPVSLLQLQKQLVIRLFLTK